MTFRLFPSPPSGRVAGLFFCMKHSVGGAPTKGWASSLRVKLPTYIGGPCFCCRPRGEGSHGHGHHLVGPPPPLGNAQGFCPSALPFHRFPLFLPLCLWMAFQTAGFICVGACGFDPLPTHHCTAPALCQACSRSWGSIHEQGRQVSSRVADLSSQGDRR